MGGDVPSGTSPTTMRLIANLGRDLLGDRFDHFNAMYERSAKHSTPHVEHHRLVGLIRYGEKAANQIQSAARRSQVTIDANRIAELYTGVEMFHRWRHHPALPDLVASLRDPSHVQHTVMLMALASVLADAGNGVGIVHGSAIGHANTGCLAGRRLLSSTGHRNQDATSIQRATSGPHGRARS
jgi:hypothetical protein